MLVAYDDVNVYVAFRCPDDNPSEIILPGSLRSRTPVLDIDPTATVGR
jgi:hypothetical protein